MPDLAKQVGTAPTCRWEGRLARIVAIHALFPQGKAAKPDYLYTSGKENRFNLAGTACLYMSVEESTAVAEFRRQFRGLAIGSHQPECHFFAEVRLHRVLNVRDPSTLGHLSVTGFELRADWGYGLPPSVSQQVGEAAAECGVEAILYESVAAAESGAAGTNIVVFRQNVQPASHLRILGPGGVPIDQWP
jgi:RES domain-containing protein